MVIRHGRLFSKTKFILSLALAMCLAGFLIRSFRKGGSVKFTIVHESKINERLRDVKKNMKNGCVLPSLDIGDPAMMKSYKKMQPVDCGRYHQDLLFVDNGTIRFHKSLPAGTNCTMFPLKRGPGDKAVYFGDPVKNVVDKSPLVSDFFKIECKEKDKMIYENIHLGVHSNMTIKNRVRSTKLSSEGLQLSVTMLGFDSMSRMSWLRRMPKTRDYFMNTLGGIELEGYGIMGDGTPAALFPILTGKHEHNLPEARRGFKGAKTVDRFPWIWKDFQANGYVGSWAEALTSIATFNYRLLGFEHSPTDFFMRPFYLAAEPTYKKYHSGCHGSLRYHQVWFNYIREMFKMYKNDPKFMFHFYDYLSHDNNNLITMGDDDLNELLLFLEEGGYLNDTLLILFADHGSRISKSRASLSGKLEERLPYFSLRFPKWFHKKHPDLIRNVKTNVKRLTTPRDIHEMLKDILRFDGSGIGNLSQEGISLFKEIPQERTCAMANVAPHWCACMAWKPLRIDDDMAVKATQAAINFINNLTEKYRDYCALLSIKSITTAFTSKVDDSVLRFKATTGDRGLEPILSDNTQNDKTLYQLAFVAAPSDGAFEVTLGYNVVENTFVIDPKAVSRLNMYGHAPDCVSHKTREIRPYCYCKQS